MFLCFFVGIETYEPVALAVQMNNRWRHNHRRIARGSDAEIINSGLEPKQTTCILKHKIEISRKDAADEILRNQLRNRNVAPVDPRFVEVSLDEIASLVVREKRHAGSVGMAILILEFRAMSRVFRMNLFY